MMEVWLVLLGAILLQEADRGNYADDATTTDMIMCVVPYLLGWGCLVLSVVLVFVNGGTTG